MDIYHKLFLVARRDLLHQAPIPPNWDPRILDLGCGTGIWAIDMADRYLNAEVLGLDLVNIQPEKIPPNLRFRVPRDYESPWTLGEDSWDLIHLRMACGSVSSWPELYQKIYTHLKPGAGWIEHVEIDLEPRCDDHTLPSESPLVKWYNYLADATARVSRPIAYNHQTRQLLQAAGFIDIQETIIRAPYNSWPNDPHQKEIGRWYNLGITEGLEALSFAPFTRVNRWDLNEHVKPLVEAVRTQICNKKIHAYNNIHIWTARRPQH
jgi:trans-aconitate methyltransferase